MFSPSHASLWEKHQISALKTLVKYLGHYSRFDRRSLKWSNWWRATFVCLFELEPFTYKLMDNPVAAFSFMNRLVLLILIESKCAYIRSASSMKVIHEEVV